MTAIDLYSTGGVNTPALAVSEKSGPELDPRRCSFIREGGTQCRGWAVRDTGLCPGHSKLGVAASPEAARAAQLQSAQKRHKHATERKRRTQDVLSALVEELQPELRAAYQSAINGEEGSLDRVRAAEMLLSRVHGKPKESVQVEVEMPEDFEALRRMSVLELARLYRQLDCDGALAELLPSDAELAEIVQIEDGPPID